MVLDRLTRYAYFFISANIANRLHNKYDLIACFFKNIKWLDVKKSNEKSHFRIIFDMRQCKVEDQTLRQYH